MDGSRVARTGQAHYRPLQPDRALRTGERASGRFSCREPRGNHRQSSLLHRVERRQQRGRGVFEKSIRALQLLNRLGYGTADSPLHLNLVYNPLGASLPPPQEKLEADYKKQLLEHFGIQFHRLYTLTNMPIKRFAAYLAQNQMLGPYMSLLVNHFNPSTVSQLMCRSLVSVGWDGKLYDCDFNQMLDIEMDGKHGEPLTIWNLDSFSGLAGSRIATGSHCFGCTAGAGSSCGGSLQ